MRVKFQVRVKLKGGLNLRGYSIQYLIFNIAILDGLAAAQVGEAF